ncbi:hypothetical protein CLOBY_27330 [Clostridium saccharobutylicum]|uniref:hypothetical protein n=1 Tax=Clostridium saccharobutylicum TaxID=169679 RepID=UPI000983E36A|nr:hypothetical protein [Clostridium saccharobutylicum]AQS10588.1 hypothetical protein CLOBY_27330 [Clostridium saccharobutylicum]MBC2438057.1 hypothetical protein [Clostridium saccharobutylicum]NSB90488.1 hypothetical protein [Clostridium saccharobutylicum]NYC31543.1 hypothetical protein [Clostridium saccharobutylicum]OOM18861.1 hypothetical protein CLSAB_03190 [Clostridium saccharobutylicum]
MGMYTGFRFKGVIKKEYREDIIKMLSEGDWSECVSSVLLDFDNADRSPAIPFGTICYMPDCWEEDTGEKDEYGEILKATNGFERYFNKETGLLCFQCSLKNYESTIEHFIEKIIPVICEQLIHCEKLYEEWDVSNLYELKDGKVKQLDYGIRYEDDEYISFSYSRKLSERKDVNIKYEEFDFTKENSYR